MLWGYREYNIHLWYIFQLLPMLFIAPFLSTMLQNIGKTGLTTLFTLAICWQSVNLYFVDLIPELFSSYQETFIDGYIVFFIIGYYFRDQYFDKITKKIKLWIPIAIICFILTGIQYVYLKNFEYTKCITWYIFIIVTWIAFTDLYKIKKERIQRILSFLARYSFISYLIHVKVIELMTKYVNELLQVNSYTFRIVVVYFFSTIISIIISSCIIVPIQKMVSKAMKR